MLVDNLRGPREGATGVALSPPGPSGGFGAAELARLGIQTYAAIDTSGKGACNADQQQVIHYAIEWIRSHYGDIGWLPGDCVPNDMQGCVVPDPFACWGGYDFPIDVTGLNPLEIAMVQRWYLAPARRIRDTIERPDMTLVIHCRNSLWSSGGTHWCSPVGDKILGYTTCATQTLDKKHINICEWFLNDVVDCTYTVEQLASVILHEMFHALGADEQAARAMERATGWDHP